MGPPAGSACGLSARSGVRVGQCHALASSSVRPPCCCCCCRCNRRVNAIHSTARPDVDVVTPHSAQPCKPSTARCGREMPRRDNEATHVQCVTYTTHIHLVITAQHTAPYRLSMQQVTTLYHYSSSMFDFRAVIRPFSWSNTQYCQVLDK